MPLSAVDFVPLTGQIKAASHRQYFDLFTGVMTDQPVTFANTLQVGGSQGAGAPPIRIVGVAAQTANMVEARALAADVQPIFSISPVGTLSWGPGGAVGTDVTLARSAANQLTLQGLAGTPALIIPVGGLRVSAGGVGIGMAPSANVGLDAGGTITAIGGSGWGIVINPTLVANQNNSILYALHINPAFNDNAFTGVVHNALRIAAGNVDFTGTGTVIANLPQTSAGLGSDLALTASTVTNAITLTANGTYLVTGFATFTCPTANTVCSVWLVNNEGSAAVSARVTSGIAGANATAHVSCVLTTATSIKLVVQVSNASTGLRLDPTNNFQSTVLTLVRIA